MTYPWYEIAEGAEVLQGDFLDRCPILIPPADFRVTPQGKGPEEVRVKVQTYDVVVMSQSCDLQTKKLDLVLVCPHCALEEFVEAAPSFRSASMKEDLRRGNVPGYHMLGQCDVRGAERGIRVVDFRTVYS